MGRKEDSIEEDDLEVWEDVRRIVEELDEPGAWVDKNIDMGLITTRIQESRIKFHSRDKSKGKDDGTEVRDDGSVVKDDEDGEEVRDDV